MEAKGEISMRMVHCEDCGKRYDYDVDGFCPRCGELGENLRQAEMAMGRLLKEQSHGRRLPGGDL